MGGEGCRVRRREGEGVITHMTRRGEKKRKKIKRGWGGGGEAREVSESNSTDTVCNAHTGRENTRYIASTQVQTNTVCSLTDNNRVLFLFSRQHDDWWHMDWTDWRGGGGQTVKTKKRCFWVWGEKKKEGEKWTEKEGGGGGANSTTFLAGKTTNYD